MSSKLWMSFSKHCYLWLSTPLLIDSSCLWNQFACSKNKCIAKQWLCDGEDDCGDGVDESVDLCGMRMTLFPFCATVNIVFLCLKASVLFTGEIQLNYYKLSNYENAIMV